MLGSFAEGRLLGERVGTAVPSVLALHGWARTHRDFARVLEPSGGEALDSIALDLPGFGAAPPPPQAWGSRQYAELVAAVLDEMATPVVVLGHSFGGRVGVELAALRPELVGGLVLTGVPLLRTGRPPRPALEFRVARRLAGWGLVSAAKMEELRHRFGSADYRAAEGVVRDVLVKVVNERYEATLGALRCPVDLVWGELDEVAPVGVASSVADRLGAQARVTVLPGVGHMVPLVAPEALRSAVVGRLAARQPPSTP